MMQFLRGRASARKLWLFAAACARRTWTASRNEHFGLEAEEAERNAAAHAAREDAAAAWAFAEHTSREARLFFRQTARSAAEEDGERAAQAGLLREVFDNPMRKRLPIAPAFLSWAGGLVVDLARAAYDNPSLPSGALDNARLLVLADALEEAECSDPFLLDHLRSGREHVRGCHVLDALLGKS
jgi:hypothetical protein